MAIKEPMARNRGGEQSEGASSASERVEQLREDLESAGRRAGGGNSGDSDGSVFGRQYPFLKQVVDVGIVLGLDFGFWSVFAGVVAVVLVPVVGFEAVLSSVMAFVSGVEWVVGKLPFVVEVAYVVGGAWYFVWLIDKRERLAVGRGVYEPGAELEWKSLARRVSVGVPLAVGAFWVVVFGGAEVVSSVVGVSEFGVTVGVVGAYWVVAYRVSQQLTRTLYEDAEIVSFRLVRSPWKWGSRMSLAMVLVFVLTGDGVWWLSAEANVAVLVGTPFVAGLYLVRRAVGPRIGGERKLSAREAGIARRSVIISELKRAMPSWERSRYEERLAELEEEYVETDEDDIDEWDL